MIVRQAVRTDSTISADVTPDTQAVLLLCSTLGTSGEVRPLTTSEYNRLALFLKDHHYRPGDLLTNGVLATLPLEADLPSTDRLTSLLERGRLLGLALTKWANFGIWVISRGDTSYPERLRRLRKKAPPLLFGAGPPPLLNCGGLAVVGSRDVDEEAVTFTREVACRCANQTIQIISGGARGVDREALTTALESGGTAVAVPSESLLKVVTNRSSRTAIRDQRFTVVSPYDPELGFSAHAAMDRNKSIYALSDYALVVRFKTKEGGTWAGVVEQLAKKSGSVDVPIYVRVANNPEDGWHELRRMGAIPFPEAEFQTKNVAELLARDASRNPTSLFHANPSPLPNTPSSSVEVNDTSPSGIELPTVPQEVRPATPEITAIGEPAVEIRHDKVERGPDEPPSAQASPSTRPGSEHSQQSPNIPVTKSPSVVPSPTAVGTESETCYTRSLPLLLRELRIEPTKNQLAEIAKRLDLLPQQFNKWLDRAIQEGLAAKRKKGRTMVFVSITLDERETLFKRNAD